MTTLTFQRTDESKHKMLRAIETYEGRWQEWTERAVEACAVDPWKALVLMAQNLRNYPLINLRNYPITNLRNHPLLGGEGSPLPPTDPLFADVVTLLGFNGTDGQTSTVDDSNGPHTWTFRGNAQLDTAKSKFGLSALLLDGAGDWIDSPDSAEWSITQSLAFTHEAFIYRPTAAAGTTGQVIAQYEATTTDRSWIFDISATEKLRWAGFNGAGASSPNWIRTSSGPITLDAWNHIVGERSDVMDVRVYIDGVQTVTEINTSVPTHNSDQIIRIGARESAGVTDFFNGWIDELRMTNGNHRYAVQSFEPPQAEFPRS